MEVASEPSNMKISLKRRTSGVRAWFDENWHRRWVRLVTYLVGLAAVGWFLLWLLVARNLPSVEQLKTYQPLLPSYVRSVDGTPIHSFARERRVQLKFEEYPPLLIRAFLAAEDKTFFEHGGLDYPGLIGAVFDYVTKLGSGERARGGSTITQQVAKNLLLSDEYSILRKLKEAILARRIEDVLTKQQILEIYLNEIALGRNSFGVQAASRAILTKMWRSFRSTKWRTSRYCQKAHPTIGRSVFMIAPSVVAIGCWMAWSIMTSSLSKLQ